MEHAAQQYGTMEQTDGYFNSMEAAHVYAVLKATLDQLTSLGNVKADPQAQAAALAASVGNEITQLLADQKSLEMRFEQLITEQHQLQNLPNKLKLVENQAEVAKVAEQLKHSTKQLCRNLKDNPNVAENMAKVAAERVCLQNLIAQCIAELETSQRIPALQDFVEAEVRKEAEMKETIERERLTTAAVKQLRSDLKEEKIKHEDEMRTKKKALLALNEQLKQVKLQTNEELRYHELEQHASNDCASRLENTNVAELEDEVSILKQKIAIEKTVHEAFVEYLNKLQRDIRQEAINWSQKCDVDTATKDKELEALKVDHQQALSQLKETKEKYEAEVALKEERDRAEREAKEREIELQARTAQMGSAATRIQAIWRGHLSRVEAKSGKAKAGAKKGTAKKK